VYRDALGANIDYARAVIADHLAVSLEAVQDEARFAPDLGADSLDLIQLAMRFEEVFGITIADDESEACETVRDALDLVQCKTEIARATQ
jgi:acyl carrier protein